MFTRRLEELADVFSVQNAGIRAKVTIALVGVLALVIPQILLTVAYMVEFFAYGTAVDRLAYAAESVEDLSRQATQLFVDGFPHYEQDLVEQTASIARLRDTAGRLAGTFPEYSAELQEIAAGVERYGEVTADGFAELREGTPDEHPWIAALERVRQDLDRSIVRWSLENPNPTADALARRVQFLEEFASTLPERLVGEALAPSLWQRANNAARWSAAAARSEQLAADILRRISSFEAQLAQRGRQAGQAIRTNVDRADRYLITLVLLTIVYITVVILVLPGRLVQPLRHVTSVMQRAGLGHLGVQARVVGTDEVGTLAQTLNQMLRRIRQFDDLKRDRIYEDRNRLRMLADLVPYPLAVLDTRHRVEHANRAFRKLFVLPDPYEDLDLIELVRGPDAAAFREALEGVLRRRRPVRRLAVALTDRRGRHSYLMTVHLGRNRAGLVSYLIVRLEPAQETAPADHA